MENFWHEVDLLVEGWQLNRFTKSLLTADDKLRRKISNTAARFDKHFRSATEIFGSEVVDFTGADFDAGLQLTPIFLMFDLGGGTLDVAIAERIRGKVNFLANGGLTMCGGW